MLRHAVCIGITALLSGCGAPPSFPPGSAVTAGGTVTVTPTHAQPSLPLVWNDGSVSSSSSSAPLALDMTSESAALRLAESAMASYARPDLPFDQWWQALAPMLSATASQAYATVSPSAIPVHAVTGRPTLPAWTTPTVARVSVSTDAGVYLVVLSRTEADPAWRVERFVAPEAGIDG